LKPIRFDPDAMHRVLLNLVTNALDACCDEACTSGDRKVSLYTSRPSGWGVEYRVCDTGCGMDAHTQSKVFRSFFTTKGSRGTGIGLMMTKNIIEKHQGTIEVRSKKGAGSEFIVRLPDLGERIVDGLVAEAEEEHEHHRIEN
jgi:signal transduction histidine kinase